jgi:hypothetical protein
MRRRDVGNEVVVALAAIGTLALALTFGIVLTISQTQPTPQPTGVQSVQATEAPSAAATSSRATLATPVATQAATQAVAQVTTITTAQATTPAAKTLATQAATQAASVDLTATWYVQRTRFLGELTMTLASDRTLTATAKTVVASAVASATKTATLTATRTVQTALEVTLTAFTVRSTAIVLTKVAETAASDRTLTATAKTLVASAVASATKTNTPTTLPTKTVTRTATAIETRTNTATLKPTNTATIKPTVTPTITNTATPTITPTILPSATFTPSKAPTQKLSSTAANTATTPQTITAAATNTTPPIKTERPTETATAAIIPTLCVPRAGWTPYIVRPGDTLFSLSRLARITLGEMQQANCISDPNAIYVGQVIVVPPGSAPSTPGSGGVNVIACDNPAVRITSPRPTAIVRGVIAVTGSATLPDFNFYKLEVRPDSGSVWNNFMTGQSPVTNGVLGTLNTGLFSPGLYWIQLTVVDKTGNFPLTPCAVRVRFSA